MLSNRLKECEGEEVPDISGGGQLASTDHSVLVMTNTVGSQVACLLLFPDVGLVV